MAAVLGSVETNGATDGRSFDASRLFLLDPFADQQADFHRFSEDCWIRNGAGRMAGQVIVPLVCLPGSEMPIEVEDPMLRAATEVRLEVDIGPRSFGAYVWYLYSLTSDSCIRRSLTVDETGVRGTMEVRTPDSRRRAFEWELRKELVWADDKIHNRRPSIGPNPTGVTNHTLSKRATSHLIKVTQQLTLHSRTQKTTQPYLPLRWPR